MGPEGTEHLKMLPHEVQTIDGTHRCWALKLLAYAICRKKKKQVLRTWKCSHLTCTIDGTRRHPECKCARQGAKLSWWSLLLNLKKIPSCVGYARVVSMFRELLREHENGEELEKKNFVLNRRDQNLEWNKLLDKPSVAVGMFSFRKLALIVCMSGNVMAVCITISCEIWYIAGIAPCVASLWISAACP